MVMRRIWCCAELDASDDSLIADPVTVEDYAGPAVLVATQSGIFCHPFLRPLQVKLGLKRLKQDGTHTILPKHVTNIEDNIRQSKLILYHLFSEGLELLSHDLSNLKLQIVISRCQPH